MKAVAFGPSLVDVCVSLKQEPFEECMREFDIEPGGWRRLESEHGLESLVRIICGGQSLTDFIASPPENSSVVAGSSVLGMLAAFKPEHRAESKLVTASAVDTEGRPDRLSAFFSTQVGKMSIEHCSVPVPGINPVGFVLNSEVNPEKILINYPGVTTEVDEYEIQDRQDALVIVDAYELQAGKLGKFLCELIDDGGHKVALSFGNQNILQDGLANSIRSFIESGKLFAVCGNENEYGVLYPGEEDLLYAGGFAGHTIPKNVPYSLLTHGPRGLTASWDGRTYNAPARYLPEESICNTSGAGDTSAGAFLSGIIAGSDATETLERAAFWATETLKTNSSLVVAQ